MSGRIVTFYSYKGGTGRSMALANTAWILAANGKKVLVVDWDLEAPGLHRFFHPFLLDKDLSETTGLLDMVWDFSLAAMEEPAADGDPAQPWYEPLADVLERAVSLRADFPPGGTLDFLGAGRQDAGYGPRVSGFDWTVFYERLGGGQFLDALRASMRQNYDFVLIDSRTGLSDTAGICTVHMPDVLVVGFTMSTQSILGAAAVAASVRGQKERLRILPVPMRVEDGESERLEISRDLAYATFDPFLDHLTDSARTRYWRAVEVPYQVRYAYEEMLAVVGERARSELSVLAAAERFTGHLTDGEITAAPPLEEARRLSLLVAYQRQRQTTVSEAYYLSYAAPDERWAQWIAAELEAAGHRTILAARDFAPGTDLRVAADRASASATTIALVSDHYLRVHQLRQELDNALDSDPGGALSRFMPVLVGRCEPPSRLTGVVNVDLVEVTESVARQRLLATVGRAATPGGFRTLPRRFPGGLPPVWQMPHRRPGFVDRTESLARLTVALSRRSVVALVGQIGAGKTRLATEYAYRHRAEYDQVVLLDATRPDVEEQLPAQVAERSLLIVDGAGDPAKHPWLPRLLPPAGGHVLVTSRLTSWKAHAEVVPVDALGPAEARTLVGNLLPGAAEDAIAALATALGGLPLAIEQAAGLIAEVGLAPAGYAALLTDRPELLDRAAPGDHPQTVTAAVAAELARLPEGPRRLLHLAAAFGPGPVPLDVLRAEPRLLVPPLPDIVSDELALAESVGALSLRSLCTSDAAALTVHPVVRILSRQTVDGRASADLGRTVVGLLAAALGADPDRPENWPTYGTLVPQVRALTSGDPEIVSVLLPEVCRYLLAVGRAEEARSVAAELRGRVERTYSDDERLQLISLMLSVAAEWAGGSPGTAALLAERAHRLARRLSGPGSRLEVCAAANLAVVQTDTGAVDSAEDALNRLVEGSAEAFRNGNQNPLYLGLAANRASVLAATRPAEAEETHRQILHVRQLLLGPAHPETLRSASAAAALLPPSSSALAEQEAVWQRRIYVLGRDHPDSWRSGFNVARTATELGLPGASDWADDVARGLLRTAGNHEHSARAATLLRAAEGGTAPAVEPIVEMQMVLPALPAPTEKQPDGTSLLDLSMMEFERIVRDLVSAVGLIEWDTLTRTESSVDGRVRDSNHPEHRPVVVHARRQAYPVSVAEIDRLAQSVEDVPGSTGLLIAATSLTESASARARSYSRLDAIDGRELARLIRVHLGRGYLPGP